MIKKETKQKKMKNELIGNLCGDDCNIHGNLKVRGRIFRGYIVKKFHKRIVVEFERIIYVKKYERYMRKKTRLHARLPLCQENKVKVGDYVEVGECRPLSKTIHFVYLNKVGERNLK